MITNGCIKGLTKRKRNLRLVPFFCKIGPRVSSQKSFRWRENAGISYGLPIMRDIGGRTSVAAK